MWRDRSFRSLWGLVLNCPRIRFSVRPHFLRRRRPDMLSNIKRGPRTPAVQRMHGWAWSEKRLDGAIGVTGAPTNPGLAGISAEPDNFCRIGASLPSHSRMSEGEGAVSRPRMPQVWLDSDPSGVTLSCLTLLARDEFDSVCPQTAEAVSQLLEAQRRLRVACSLEVDGSGRFSPTLLQLLAHSQGLVCEALPQPQEGCGR